jgi:hypothetical protein
MICLISTIQPYSIETSVVAKLSLSSKTMISWTFDSKKIGSIHLRGGGDIAMSSPTVDKSDPKDWSIENVQEFLESLRPKFGIKTDIYRQIFTDNDIDGNILLGLNLQKLESLGIRSLGHREYLFDAIQNIRVSTLSTIQSSFNTLTDWQTGRATWECLEVPAPASSKQQ